MCSFAVASLLWRYLVTIWTVSPSHYQKYTFDIDFIHVDLAGENDAVFKYLTKYVWFVTCYALLILCYGSLPICRLLFMFYKGTIHNTAVFYLVPVLIVCSYLIMWMFMDVKTALNTASHIFKWILMNCVSLLLGYGPLWLLQRVVAIPI